MHRQYDMSTSQVGSLASAAHGRRRAASWVAVAALLTGVIAATSSESASATPFGASAYSLPHTIKAASAACSGEAIALENSGFEQPTIDGGFRIFNHALLPAWSTTARDQAVELWRSGFKNVPAFAGDQFAELNANMPSALYQDLDTVPGATIHWSLAHRGRDGTDVMRVLIGAPGGTLREVARLTDGNRAWGRHSGGYTVPAGQTVTRFQFEAVSAAGGASVGNFLDDITFGNDACIELVKNGTLIGDGAPGDRIRWTVSATNRGGSPATNLTITDPIPADTVYATDSLTADTGPRSGQLTDAADADSGSSSAAGVRVVPVGETKIAGRLNPGETTRFTFETTIESAASASTVLNTATAEYDVASGDTRTVAASDTVKVPPATDVSITKTFDKSAVLGINGVGAAGFSLEVMNNGPSRAATVTVTDPLPAGLVADVANISIDGDVTGGSCSVAGTTPAVLTCTVGAMSDGEVAIITVPATFTKQIQGSVFVANEARVAITGAADSDLSNNISSDVMAFDPGPNADVAVAVTALNTVMEPGDPIAWNVDVQNATAGVADAFGVFVDITMPYNVTLSSTPAGCTQNNRVLTCDLATLPSQAIKSIVVEAVIDGDAPDGGVLELSATVRADAGSNELTSNDTSSDSIRVRRLAHLAITKVALGPVGPTVGTDFEVTVSSIGRFGAENVMLHDFFGNATVGQMPAGCTEVNEGVVCELGDLAPGETRTLLFTLIPVDATSPIENRAEATAVNVVEIVKDSAIAQPIVVDPGERRIPPIYFQWRDGDRLPEVTDSELALPRTGMPPWAPIAAGVALIAAGVMLRRRVLLQS